MRRSSTSFEAMAKYMLFRNGRLVNLKFDCEIRLIVTFYIRLWTPIKEGRMDKTNARDLPGLFAPATGRTVRQSKSSQSSAMTLSPDCRGDWAILAAAAETEPGFVCYSIEHRNPEMGGRDYKLLKAGCLEEAVVFLQYVRVLWLPISLKLTSQLEPAAMKS